MPLRSRRTTHYRESLSSLLTWSRHNSLQSIGPIIFEDDDAKLATERNKEIQLTLDKLEGRLVVASDGNLKRGTTGSLDGICGLMSILAEGGRASASGESEMSSGARSAGVHGRCGEIDHHSGANFGSTYQGSSTPAACCAVGLSSQFRDGGTLDLGLDGTVDRCENRCYTPWGCTGPPQKDDNIIHPAFNVSARVGAGWDTSSRISDDSLFDEHDRHHPDIAGPSSFSYGRRDMVELPYNGPWSYTDNLHLPFPIETAATSDDLGSFDFFDTSMVHGAVVPPNLTDSMAHHRMTVTSVSPILLNNGSSPFTMARIKQKSSVIKKILKVIVKPLKMIGSLGHGTAAGGVPREPPISTEDLDNKCPRYHRGGKPWLSDKSKVVKQTIGHRLLHKEHFSAE